MTFQTALLRWFSKNSRPLPWRRHYRPYEVWVSEIMLQQTQMDTVLPYFDRWMKTFPDIRTLAKAEESKVLKHWQGLGYYSRARNLHAAAKILADKYGGEFPSDFETIRGLKGIGRYTAGAIASIAFNEPRPIVDGNIIRVLSRFYAIRRSIDEPKHRETLWALQERLIPKGQARNFNQALMELGALVCTPKNPQCTSCPAARDCRAFQEGAPERYPVRHPRKKSVRVTAAAVVIRNKKRCLILRRPVGEIMGGLWEFPEWKLGNERPEPAVVRRLSQETLGLSLTDIQSTEKIKRSYTHHLETLHCFAAQAADNKVTLSPKWLSAWIPPAALSRYPFSSAHAKIAASLSP